MVRKKPKRKVKRAQSKVLTPEIVKRGPGSPGRKGVFEEWMCEEAKDLCGKLGARIDDLALHFGVVPATIDYWIKNYHSFSRAVKQGRTECTLKVAQALFNRAVGYSHPDTHIMSQTVKKYDEKGKVVSSKTEPLLIPIIKHYPPDTAAAVKYLSILAREQGWSEIHQVNMDVNHRGDINIHKIEELSMDDLSDEVKKLLFDLNLKQLSNAQLQ
jgi:hypothetical protein